MTLGVFWTTCGWRCGNAGDEVNREITSALAGHPVGQVEEARGAELVAIGSVGEKIPHDFAGAVWGTGLMFEESRAYTPEARVTALRGRLTLRRWEGVVDVVLGDPGLLAADVLGVERKAPRYRVGLVPHYADGENEDVRAWACRWRDEVAVIDICARPRDVLSQMAACEYILSSSLHGLVFADSLGIPNEWVRLSERVNGGSFKFRDYLSAFGIADPLARSFGPSAAPEDIVSRAESYARPGIASIKQALRDSFPFPGVG